MNRRGFVLPLALVVMVALSVIAVTVLQVTTSDLMANRSMRLASRALFAAEAGADRTIASWSSGPYAILAAGDSVSTGWKSLPDGAAYRSTVLRVDDGSAPTPIFLIRTDGRPSRLSAARRQVVIMVVAGTGQACCEAAFTLRGRLQIRGPGGGSGRGRPSWANPPQVDGRDHVPYAWAGYCPAVSDALPGVAIDRADAVQLQRGATIEGDPAIAENASLSSSAGTALGGTTYDDLASTANLRFPSNTRLRGSIRPSARHGECNTADNRNWGAPTTPASACWDYLPVIHAEGNLRIDADGEGQGILLVDGDLTIDAEFEFYGIVVVKGRAILRDEAVITGGLVVANGYLGREESQIREDAQVRFSSCAASRASGSLVSGARFLDGRHWFEVP